MAPVGNAAIGFTLVDVMDLSGGLRRTLVPAWNGPGTAVVAWDGTDDRGEALAGGVYFVRLTSGGRSEAKRLLILR